jgi:hypothetical protein
LIQINTGYACPLQGLFFLENVRHEKSKCSYLGLRPFSISRPERSRLVYRVQCADLLSNASSELMSLWFFAKWSVRANINFSITFLTWTFLLQNEHHASSPQSLLVAVETPLEQCWVNNIRAVKRSTWSTSESELFEGRPSEIMSNIYSKKKKTFFEDNRGWALVFNFALVDTNLRWTWYVVSLLQRRIKHRNVDNPKFFNKWRHSIHTRVLGQIGPGPVYPTVIYGKATEQV